MVYSAGGESPCRGMQVRTAAPMLSCCWAGKSAWIKTLEMSVCNAAESYSIASETGR